MMTMVKGVLCFSSSDCCSVQEGQEGHCPRFGRSSGTECGGEALCKPLVDPACLIHQFVVRLLLLLLVLLILCRMAVQSKVFAGLEAGVQEFRV